MRAINELARLRGFVNTFPSQKAAALTIGVSQPFLNQMLKEKRPIPEKVLTVLGLTRRQTIAARK